MTKFMDDMVGRFIAEPNKEGGYKAKGGNVRLYKEGSVVKLVHYGTTILEVDLDKEYTDGNFYEQVTKWHIQSATDARYISSLVRRMWQSLNIVAGYGSVRGSSFRVCVGKDEKGKEVYQEIGGEY